MLAKRGSFRFSKTRGNEYIHAIDIGQLSRHSEYISPTFGDYWDPTSVVDSTRSISFFSKLNLLIGWSPLAAIAIVSVIVDILHIVRYCSRRYRRRIGHLNKQIES